MLCLDCHSCKKKHVRKINPFYQPTKKVHGQKQTTFSQKKKKLVKTTVLNQNN